MVQAYLPSFIAFMAIIVIMFINEANCRLMNPWVELAKNIKHIIKELE